MEWNEVSKKIDEKIKVGTKIPKTDGSAREVTKIKGNKIQMRVGVETEAKKYTTKEMVKFAFEIINSGEFFASDKLKSKFQQEYNQGPCVFSMTGGVLEFIGIVKCIPNPNGRGFAYISINEK